MAGYKKAPKPKGKGTLKPKNLGSGLAAKAGKSLTKSSRMQRECKAMGGKWKGGKCSY